MYHTQPQANTHRVALQQFLHRQMTISEEAAAEVVQSFEEQAVATGEVLLRRGQTARYAYFVNEGCLLSTIHNQYGEENSLELHFEGDWLGATDSFLHRRPGPERIAALEPSLLLRLEREEFERLCSTVGPLRNFCQRLMQSAARSTAERLRSLMTMSALERMRWLQAKRPHIFTRLPNRLVASYLGIAEATLSRLKVKL